MQITDEMIEAALRGWCGYGPDVDLSKYQQAPETKEAWRRALEAALGAMPECESDLLKRLRNQSPALGLSESGVPRPITERAAACIEDLAAALEPFAECASENDYPDSWNVWGGLKFGDLRRVRAVRERWGLK